MWERTTRSQRNTLPFLPRNVIRPPPSSSVREISTTRGGTIGRAPHVTVVIVGCGGTVTQGAFFVVPSDAPSRTYCGREAGSGILATEEVVV